MFEKKVSTMSTPDVIRSWKDEEYRLSLSHEQRAMLPAHPAGVIELVDEELDAAGGTIVPLGTFIFCNTVFSGGGLGCLFLA
jgi:mersacidin/lichenicidin family type 2 lantibiotic